MMLPVAQCAFVGIVDFDQVEQGMRTMLPKPVVQLVAEAAEMPVFAITQRKDGITQMSKRRRLPHYAAHESQSLVRWVAFTGRAGDEKHTAGRGQQCVIDFADGT